MTTTADHERTPLPLKAIGTALFIAVAITGAWGWFARGKAFQTDDTLAWLIGGGIGFALLAALCFILQIGAAYGAQAARRAKGWDLDVSTWASIGLVIVGDIVTAWSLHNAMEMTGLFVNASLLAHIGYMFASIAFPVVENSIWWVDEALQSEAGTRQARDQEQALTDGRNADKRASGPLGLDTEALDYTRMTDEAIDTLISTCASVGKLAQNERGRRRRAA